MIDFVGYGNRLAAVVDERVGAGGLVGVYVHGSAVLGGFRPERSDVDVLVVVANPVPADRQAALGAALLAAAYPCPGIGLELSVITAATAADLGDCRIRGARRHAGSGRDRRRTPRRRRPHPLRRGLPAVRVGGRRAGAGVGVRRRAVARVWSPRCRPRWSGACRRRRSSTPSSTPAARCASRPTARCGRRSPAASGISPSIRTTRSFARRWTVSAATDAAEPSRDDVLAFVDAARRRIGEASR